MDFEEIDKVHGDALNTGDIVCDDDGDFLALRKIVDDDDDLLTFDAENLTNSDGEDTFIAQAGSIYYVYRSY